MEKASRAPKFFISALILLLFLMASYPLCMRLISRIYYQKAVNRIWDGCCEPAVDHLETAIRYQANDFLIWKELGRAYHNLGALMPVKEAFGFATKAKHAYVNAVRCNHLDVEATYGLAREEARLEQIYPYLYHQNNNLYHALPYFEEAIRLRPNGILYHHALTRYLHQQKKTESLLKVVSNLARIYPPIYGYLKKESFWSSPVREAVKKGLQQAIDIDEEIASPNAHVAMSSLMAGEKDWDSMELAIQKATVLDPKNSRYHLIFSKVLKRLKKLKRAEKKAGLALDHSVEPLHWLFDHRAWIRWSRKDYQGAVKDWKSAIAVKPKKASFYARAAEAYCKLGEWSRALDHYQKAMDLDPKNENYRKRYNALRAKHPNPVNPA